MSHHHALLIGKFYPPHRGHGTLIAAARAAADRVSVVVRASGAESVPLAERVEWVREDYGGDGVVVTGVRCEAPLDLGDEAVWLAQVAAIQAALRLVSAGDVDLVVSGEAYGARLATFFAADHQRLDRAVDLVSATRLRSDLTGRWDDLGPAVRAGLACRIVVLGAESTGTTTLADALAAHYRARGGVWARTTVVYEYGRDYTRLLWDRQVAEARDRSAPEPGINDLNWKAADFDAIAEAQTQAENQAAAEGSPLLVCDTDAFATSVWERRYLGSRARSSPSWSRRPARPRHHLYLLTGHAGVPWVDDGIREGELDVRADMTTWFADALTMAGEPWVMLEGSPPQRLDLAIRSIDPVLARCLHLSDPLTGPGFGAPQASGSR